MKIDAPPAAAPDVGRPMPVVSVQNLSKRYGRYSAVDDVTFDVMRGEVLGLLGPNGSGKTTILRVLTGYLNASSGRVRVAGFDVVEQGIEARKRVGYVPEDAPLYAHMRVHEALEFMGSLKGLAGAALATAVEDAGAQLSLEPVWRRAVSKLSRGYRQRVAIAQALLNEPDLLVLDEPTNGLDPRQIIELRELIRTLSQRHTLIVTSHILAEIERVASRVLILLDGKLLAAHSLGRDGAIHYRLKVGSSDPLAVAAALRAVPGVIKVDDTQPEAEPTRPERATPDGVCQFKVELENRSAVQALAPAVVQGGHALVELTEMSVELESVFLEVTRHNAA